jgi:aspartate 1-decarboxylase
MQIEVLKSKIHRVKVTEPTLNYMGSIASTRNEEASGLIEN